MTLQSALSAGWTPAEYSTLVTRLNRLHLDQWSAAEWSAHRVLVSALGTMPTWVERSSCTDTQKYQAQPLPAGPYCTRYAASERWCPLHGYLHRDDCDWCHERRESVIERCLCTGSAPKNACCREYYHDPRCPLYGRFPLEYVTKTEVSNKTLLQKPAPVTKTAPKSETLLPEPPANDNAQLDCVVIDVETGGMKPECHALLEIAAIRANADGKEVSTYRTLVLPREGTYCEQQALQINRHQPTKEWWRKQARPEHQAISEFVEWLPTRYNWIGFNCSFDLRFLEHVANINELQLPKPAVTLDLMAVARRLHKSKYLPNYKLESLCTFLGVTNQQAHSGLADVQRTLEVYKRLLVKQLIQPGVAA